MSVVLSSDDLQPGLYCTVLRGKRQKLQPRASSGAAQPATRECYDYLKGVPLQVLHAEGPYLVAHVVSNGEKPRAILDLRDVQLCRVSREYIRAVTGKEYQTTL